MENIRDLRKAKGLTQKQLAKLIDVTESQVSQIENGKRNPGFETLLKLGEVFGCSVDDIVRGKKIPATESDGQMDDESQARLKECNDIFKSYSPEKQELALKILKSLT